MLLKLVRRGPLVLGVITAITDLVAITLAYGAARIVIDADSGTHYLHPAPVLWATIPAWIVVFFALGLYRSKRIVGPSLPAPRLILGVLAAIVVMTALAFSWAIDLSRPWIVFLSVIAIAFVLLGRLAVLGLAQLLYLRPSP